MTYCVNPDRVVDLNRVIVAGSGEPHGVLSRTALESALFRPVATWEGVYLYPTVIMRGAALLEALCQAHPFQQGNKRTAWITSVTYLHMHNVAIRTDDQDAVAEFVTGIVTHKHDLGAVTLWLAGRHGMLTTAPLDARTA